MRLENWALEFRESDLYSPPECQAICLTGEIYGDSRHEDGKRIITSNIVDVNGNIVITKHSQYQLGDPHPDYVKWCKDQGYRVPTKEQPIVLHFLEEDQNAKEFHGGQNNGDVL